MQRLGQMDLWIPHGVSDGIVLLLPRERQLRERRLVARRLLDVDEVLVVRHAVVLGQLKQADEGLEQRRPGSETHVIVNVGRDSSRRRRRATGMAATTSHHSFVYSVSIIAGHSVRTLVMPTAQIFFSTTPETFWTSGMMIFSKTMPNILQQSE